LNLLPTVLGLSIALAGPIVLVSPAHKLLGDQERLQTKILEQLFLWLLVGLVLSILTMWEKESLATIGLRFQWQSGVWGLLLAGVLIFLVSPVLIWMLKKMQLPGFETGLAKLNQLPVCFLIFAVITGGTAEEILYRGYAIARLSLFVGYGWAGLIALTVFAVAHLPLWGWGSVLTFFISGGLFTGFYLLSHDLLACIVAHVLTDSIGLIFAPRQNIQEFEE
jgi:uncharacterized protein